MRRLVIIAGPQAAGKSAIISKLCSQPYNVGALFPKGKIPLLFPLQESRQIIVHKHMLLGAIFMTLEHELEVVNCDLERMDLLLQRNQDHLVYVDECNIFTVAHAEAHGVAEVMKYWPEYVMRLVKLNAVVIFLDVPPDVSWDRRRQRYEQRLIYFPEAEHEALLRQYQEYLAKLYPLLRKVYDWLPLPKTIVNGNSSEENVIKMVCQQMTDLTDGFS